MDLWIRSQDKSRLGKIVYIELQESDYGYHLIGWRDKFDGTRIATYKSKERALEVLNEIQSCMQTNCLFDLYSKMGNFPDDFNKKWNCVPVYVMPKE